MAAGRVEGGVSMEWRSLDLSKAAAESIRNETLRAFPEEGCGFLLGPRAGALADEARPVANIHPGPRESRYRIDALELVRLDDSLEGSPRRLLGVFHSHPGSPARPSQTDRDAAWPGFVYVIQDVRGGVAGELRGWVLGGDEDFVEIPLRVTS